MLPDVANGSPEQPIPSAIDARLSEIAQQHVQEGELSAGRSAWNTLSFLAAPVLEIPSNETSAENAAVAFLVEESALFDLADPGVSLVHQQTHFDATSSETVVRVQQGFEGRPVWNAGATVRVGDDLTVRLVATTLVPSSALSDVDNAIPDLTAAESAALSVDGDAAVVGAEEGIWVQPSTIVALPRVQNAWRLNLLSSSDRIRIVYVGTQGEILEDHEMAQQAKHLGLYSWNNPSWDLVYDDFCHGDPPPANCATCPRGWCSTNGCSSTSTWPGTAYEAKIAHDEAYWYFLNEHDRDSWDGNGGLIRVHTNYGGGCSAEWQHNINNYPQLVYEEAAGDCLDIPAHEYTHLIDLGHGHLLGLGLLSEGIPDIFAQFVEKQAYGSTDWVFQGQNCHELCQHPLSTRPLNNPESYGYSGNYATATASKYPFGLVLGKSAYLMGREPAEGSETYWGVSVTGTGSADAEQIWHDAIWGCLPPNAKMQHLRDCLEWRGCSAPYGQSTCDSVNSSLDAIGLWRRQELADPVVTPTREVSVAKVLKQNSDRQYLVYQDLFSGMGSDYVWLRRRTCPKAAACTSSWDTPVGLGVTWAGTVGAAAHGNHVYLAGRPAQGGIELRRYNDNNGQVTLLNHFTGSSFQPDGGVSMAEFNGDIYMFWKQENTTTINGVFWRVSDGAWSLFGGGMSSPARPTVASGTMDGVSPSANNGLWVFYQHTTQANGIAYRRYDVGSGWSSVLLAGTQSNLTGGAPGVAVWRGRVHLAGRTTPVSGPSQTFHKSCSMPCGTNDWTIWREHDPTAKPGLTLFGLGPVLELWHMPSDRLHYRLKYGN